MNIERSKPFWQRFLSTFTVLVMVSGIVPFVSSQAVPTAVRVLSGDEFNSHLRAETATFNGITSNIYNQDGLGFSGMIAPNPLANPLTMTGYSAGSVGLTSTGFIGGVFDGYYIWMIPSSASHVVKANKNTGAMIGYNAWPSGFTKGSDAFWGGVFDGQNVWLIPYNADRVIKVDKDTGTMIWYGWPYGFTKGYNAFAGGVFDGQYIWMIPASADRVIRVYKNTGTMTGYNAWPDGFIKKSLAFLSGVFDGQNIWLIPYNTDRVVKVDKDTGTMRLSW